MFAFENVKGIIFDLDDTLVRTNLDFGLIKRQIGCPSNADILTFIDELPTSKMQKHAHNIVIEHELNDAHSSTWMPGAKDFVNHAKALSLPLAIVTRNCVAATQIKIQQNKIPIDMVITREDAPAKPNPLALHMINNVWQFDTQDIAYIGDYKYDIEAAHNANMQAWLFSDRSDGSSFSEQLQLVL